MTNPTITRGTTAIAGHPDGFLVDGDALDGSSLTDRARKMIGTDSELLTAARTWLGSPLEPVDPPLASVRVTLLTDRLYAAEPVTSKDWYLGLLAGKIRSTPRRPCRRPNRPTSCRVEESRAP